MLRDLRKEYLKLGLPPFVVFQDPSLEDMALKNILFQTDSYSWVGEGKAKNMVLILSN
jgi:ATP-dependent DNA helicase RecQ